MWASDSRNLSFFRERETETEGENGRERGREEGGGEGKRGRPHLSVGACKHRSCWQWPLFAPWSGKSANQRCPRTRVVNRPPDSFCGASET